jgi:hypothetical protein
MLTLASGNDFVCVAWDSAGVCHSAFEHDVVYFRVGMLLDPTSAGVDAPHTSNPIVCPLAQLFSIHSQAQSPLALLFASVPTRSFNSCFQQWLTPVLTY